MSRPSESAKRGPAFLLIDGVPYLNLSFHLDPRGPDVRDRIVEVLELEAEPAELCVCRRLTAAEAKLWRALMDDAEAEAWARIVGYR